MQVFQRRMDNNTSFYQDWIAYKEGFGDNSGNVWLGNEKLHYLTTGKNFMLRIDITTADGQPLYAEYTEFAIESETTNYRMNKLGTHSGNTGSLQVLLKNAFIFVITVTLLYTSV